MPRKRKGLPITGWLVIDKPVGIGSTDVVRAAKRSLKPQKVGHAGTLDPFATGILPLAFGEATKTIPFAQEKSKDYLFTLAFGAETDTLDTEGVFIKQGGSVPNEAAIETVLSQFLGQIMQKPPAYSALKIDGARAYDLARAGVDVDIPARPVFIEKLALLGSSDSPASFNFSVTCGKGTYVRSLGRDIAASLGTYGTLTRLRRTRVGSLTLDQSISVEMLSELGNTAPAESALLDLATVLDDIPALAVTRQIGDRFRQGQPVDLAACMPEEEPTPPSAPGNLLLIRCEGHALALAEQRGPQVWPVRVFNQNLI